MVALIEESAKKLGYTTLKEDQVNVITCFVNGQDIFAVLPTGYGKSLCYQCLPYIFDKTRGDGIASVIIIITPLVAIIKDQVSIKLYVVSVLIKYFDRFVRVEREVCQQVIYVVMLKMTNRVLRKASFSCYFLPLRC